MMTECIMHNAWIGKVLMFKIVRGHQNWTQRNKQRMANGITDDYTVYIYTDTPCSTKTWTSKMSVKRTKNVHTRANEQTIKSEQMKWNEMKCNKTQDMTDGGANENKLIENSHNMNKNCTCVKSFRFIWHCMKDTIILYKCHGLLL